MEKSVEIEDLEGFYLEMPRWEIGGRVYLMGGEGYLLLGVSEFRYMLEGLNMGLEEFSGWYGGKIGVLRRFVDTGEITQRESDRIRAVLYVLCTAGKLVGRCE